MIRIEHIEKTYDRRTSHANHVLKDISLTFPDTGFICILGPSGCGKTTLMNVIGGLDTFDSGTISTGNVTVKKYGTAVMEQERNEKFGYIFQNYYLLSERSVTYNVYLGLHSLEDSRREKLRRVKRALRAVGMERYARKKAGELSGGQQQRVAIARALARKPQVIFADEPTGNLDATNTAQVCDMLKKISAECLVVMVTHEEKVAADYADRIIRLDEGRIVSDILQTAGAKTAEAEETSAGSVETLVGSERLSAGSVETLVGSERLSAGSVEKMAGSEEKAVNVASALGVRDCYWEAKNLITAKGKRTKSLIACLMIVTALLILTVSDYLTLATIRPEDFIITDSHLVEVKVERGGFHNMLLDGPFAQYMEYLEDAFEEAGVEVKYLPVISDQILYSSELFAQMRGVNEQMYGFSCIPVSLMSRDALVCGRMPENQSEIVVDVWTLQRFLDRGGILQASVGKPEQFLNEVFSTRMKGLELTVVGICDSGEPSVYMDAFTLLSIAASGTTVMSLENLQKIAPGRYDDIILEDNECLAGPDAKTTGIGKWLGIANIEYRVKDFAREDITARVVVNADQEDRIIRSLMDRTRNFYIYSSDKETVKELAEKLPAELFGIIEVTVIDYHTQYTEQYQAAAEQKVGARAVVTATILVISAIMLILILKARVNGRVEMLSVYRLLGISHRRIGNIFALETVLLSACSALPAAIAVWAMITGLTIMPSIDFSMELPIGVAALAYLGSFCFHLVCSLVPVFRLLRLPPAVLAGKYDF